MLSMVIRETIIAPIFFKPLPKTSSFVELLAAKFLCTQVNYLQVPQGDDDAIAYGLQECICIFLIIFMHIFCAISQFLAFAGLHLDIIETMMYYIVTICT